MRMLNRETALSEITSDYFSSAVTISHRSFQAPIAPMPLMHWAAFGRGVFIRSVSGNLKVP